MKIIVDTREQLPMFKNGTIRRKLDVGDYSTTILENKFAIERKSPQDLYGSLVGGHERFMNEILLAERRNIHLVLFVECCYEEFVSMTWRGGSRVKMRPKVLKRLTDTTFRRRGLQVFWCKSRDGMKKAILDRLNLEEEFSKL